MLESMIMEFRQLEYFVAVAAEANFTRAAAKLHVAQPGVSAQVRRLERELGQPLLDRSERTVRLTEAGVAVLPYARAALAAVAGARLAVDELTGLMRGHVAIGMVTSHSIDLPGLLASFHHDHPAVEISLSEGNSDQLIRALHAGQLDLAVIGSTTPVPGQASNHASPSRRATRRSSRNSPAEASAWPSCLNPSPPLIGQSSTHSPSPAP